MPDIRHKDWQKLGLMKPLEPGEHPQYKFSDLTMTLGLHLGCNMYGHGWILDNVDLRNCSANGYTTFTGTLPVVLEIHKTDNNGGIGWTYGNVYIKNGLITSIPQ